MSGMLIAGRFESKGADVTGVWPISKEFVTSLSSTVDLGNKK